MQIVDPSHLFDTELEQMDEFVDESGKICEEVRIGACRWLAQILGKGHNWH